MELTLEPTNKSFDVDEKSNFGIDRVASFLVNVADAPIAYRAPGHFLDDERFDAVLVPHRVALARDGGYREIVRLGLHATYESELPGQTLSVLAQMPTPEFVDLGTLVFGAKIDANGSIGAASAVPSLTKDDTAKFSMTASSSSQASLTCAMRLVSPRVSVVGVGAREAVWIVEGGGSHQLHGAPVETWSLLVVPTGLDEIRYRLRVWMRHRLFVLPNDWETTTKEPIRATIVDLPT